MRVRVPGLIELTSCMSSQYSRMSHFNEATRGKPVVYPGMQCQNTVRSDTFNFLQIPSTYKACL